MLILKKDTVPKSDIHSIDTNASPAKIAGLAEGKIIERGTHRQLLLQKGLYAQMWERQSSGFQDDDLPSTIVHNKAGLQGV